MNVKSIELKEVHKKCYELEQFTFKGYVDDAIKKAQEVKGIMDTIIKDLNEGAKELHAKGEL